MATDIATLAERAEALRALHQGPDILVLPNAWDAASARAVVEAGFPAVATSSVAVAASLGWPDGEEAPADEVFAAIGRIARAVSVPVTADIEGGYGYPPQKLAEALVAAGAVGCNIEDTDHSGDQVLHPVDEQAAYVSGVVEAARGAGVPLVVNARTDVFLRQVGDPGERAGEALRRAAAYRDAGADCIFPIMIEEEHDIRALVEGAGLPINVYMRDGMTIAGLKALGVRRVSFGGALHHAALGALQDRLLAIRSETF
ncbi:MAG: hypothetical protein QOE92_1667 [Chloroflexota bacterium]|jgi:2-methylisocitrate lyase-like PEP mutase family enzyme|nr:hypothetical protein [Chloroflexota bacterium]